MDRENVKRLRLNVRLIGRRGWIGEKELEQERSALPDVSDKIAGTAEPSGAGGADPVA
ncbi:MAG: hypothetical protein QF890_07845 [Myxococcota bacterium]|jgi:hypothetical protein|nr:hypothetical protein [bacterium]MDP6074965.1 hypothetical protein [Myxococcota bacterium]MDP6243101.1 hypothetical protein [Myxococcota bacterium]MDP7076276.1 hypothetical protein [Myxococcota bacterium]MDP7298077.1 hypothetical protein [Myxococcota bacterium]